MLHPRESAIFISMAEPTIRTDSQGRRISRGAHPAKAQAELDGMHWTERDRIERERKHALLVTNFKRPSHRPSVYEPDTMPERVYAMLTSMEVIFTKKLVAAHLGVDESTFRRWQTIHPDLQAAVAQGLAVQEAWLASQMADGMKYSASMYAVLKNLHEWKETQETTHKLGIGEALEQQAAGAKRVDWDRTRPDPLAATRQRVIDASVVEHAPVPAAPASVATVDSAAPATNATQPTGAEPAATGEIPTVTSEANGTGQQG